MSEAELLPLRQAAIQTLVILEETPMVALSQLLRSRGNAYRQNDLTEDSKAIMDALKNSMAVIEFSMDGTICDANDIFLRALEYRREDVVGVHHKIFVDKAESSSSSYHEFWRALNRGEFQQGEFRRITQSGKEIWIQACYTPILGPDRRPIKVVKIAADITEMVQNRMQAEVDRETLLESLSMSVSEMTSTIQEISTNVNSTATLAADSVASVRQTTDTVENLSNISQNIEEVVDVIRRLADQTNLLALNATIESARAGSAGKGFAVVANEVKELARQTTDATSGIATSINEIQAAVKDVVSSATEVDTQISTVNDNMAAIAAAVEEQSVTMNSLDAQTRTA